MAGSLFLWFGKSPILASLVTQSSNIQQPLLFFDSQEYALFMAVADRLLGPRSGNAPSLEEVGQRADTFLAGAHPEIQEQFHILLTLFDSAFVAFLFDLRFSTFQEMSPEGKDTYLDDWMTSPLAFRRTAFQGLKRLAMSVYYTHPGSWETIGFDGAYAE